MNRAPRMSVCAALALAAAGASANIVFRDNVPDFYQHQKTDVKNYQAGWMPNPLNPSYDAKDWWEHTGGGWCATAAWTDAIASQESRYPGIFDNSKRKGADKMHTGKTWLERATYAHEDLAITAGKRFGLTDGACAWKTDVLQYSKNAGYDKAIIDEFALSGGKVKLRENVGDDPSKYKDTGFSTMLSLMNQALKGNRAVVLFLLPGTNNTTWWTNAADRRSFHVVTLSAVDFDNSQIYFADPDNTFRGGGFDLTTHSYRDARYRNTDDTPWGDPRDPKVADRYYSRVSLKDGYVFDSGPYKGAYVSEVYTYAVPAPGALALAGLGFLANSRRRRESRA